MVKFNKIFSITQFILILISLLGLISIIIPGPIEQSASSDIEYFFVYVKILKLGLSSIILILLCIFIELKIKNLTNK